MIVYRPTDRIAVQVGEVSLKISPLSYEQRTNLLALTVMKNGKAERDAARSSFLTLKAAIKEVDKLPEMKFSDGSEVKLEWENGALKDESLEILIQVMGSIQSPQLSTALILGRFQDSPEGIVFGEEKKTN